MPHSNVVNLFNFCFAVSSALPKDLITEPVTCHSHISCKTADKVTRSYADNAAMKL